jgi:hypothetical protein
MGWYGLALAFELAYLCTLVQSVQSLNALLMPTSVSDGFEMRSQTSFAASMHERAGLPPVAVATAVPPGAAAATQGVPIATATAVPVATGRAVGEPIIGATRAGGGPVVGRLAGPEV